MKTDSRPFVNIDIFSKRFVCLLDSGSNNCIAGISGIGILKSFGLKIDKTTIPFLKTADSTGHKIEGVFYVSVCFNNVYKVVPFLAVPTLAHTFILGVDFWKEFDIKLSFNDNVWVCNLFEVTSTNSPALICKDELDMLQTNKLESVISKFRNIGDPDRLGRIRIYEHHIETGTALPFKQNPYPVSPVVQKRYWKQLDELLKLDVVEPSNSPWCSPTILVKKSNGIDRLCIDSRKLNKVTKKDSYPLPRVSYILDRLGRAVYLSSIDLKFAFHQIPLTQPSKEKTAFSIPGRGLFQYKVLPFGLNNAAQCLQRVMDCLFGHSLGLENKIFVYLDDLVIVSESFEEHLEILEVVVKRLSDANLTINFEKCQFCRPELKY